MSLPTFGHLHQLISTMFCNFFHRHSPLAKLEKTMANIADTLADVQAKVVALQAAVAALPTTGGTADNGPVLAAVAGVQTAVDAVKAELTPTA